jgi:hypothetical protein
MSPLSVRRALATLSSFAVAGAVVFIAPASADAATYRAFGGSGHGSEATFGTVINSGRTAYQTLCTTRSGVTKSNHTAAATRPSLGTIGAQTTTVQSKKSGSTESSITTASTAATNLLPGLLPGGIIQASTIVSKSTVSHNSSGYHAVGTTTLVGLKVMGIARDNTPAKNTTIQLPGFGKLVLNEQSTSTSFGDHTMGVNGLRLVLTAGNAAGLPAGQVVISRASSSLHSPTHNRAFGEAYGTRVQVGGLLSSGPTAARVYLPCGGSNGATRTNGVTSTNSQAGAVTTGAAASTAKSTDTATATTSTTTSGITGGINFLAGIVTADSATAKAATTRKGTTVTRSSSGTTITNLRINGTPVTIPSGANRTINIAGVGTLYLHRVITESSGLHVYALQLVLSTAQGTLPGGAVLSVGSAQSGVSYH